MDGATSSFTRNSANATKGNEITKRNFSILVSESKTSHAEKKKKLLKNVPPSKLSRCDNPKFLEYVVTDNYVRVVANPALLPPTPLIFQPNQFKKISDHEKNMKKKCDQFLLKFVNERSLNQEVSERFRQVLNGSDDDFEVCCDKIEEKEKKNKKERNKVKDVREKQGLKEIRCSSVGKVSSSESKKGPGKRETCEGDQVQDQENVKVSQHVDIYKINGRQAFIFHMCHPAKFSFHGELKATILAGEIEILGYTLSYGLNKKSVTVYSPNFCTPLVVETKVYTRQHQLGADVIDKLKEFLSEEDCTTLLSKLKPHDSVLLIEQIVSDLGIVLNKYMDRALFPKDLEDVSSETEASKSLQSVFSLKLSNEEKHFRKNNQWDKIPLGQCTVLCGGKGVGKSTLLRYYVNKLLRVGEKVLVVDLDPGQPEFTFPGCISAVVVEEPILGPSFTHISEPAIMAYFGDVSVGNNPNKYLQCVTCVLEGCKHSQELNRMKWLINTMGFSKGLGVDLMVTILKLFNPNTVVQIKSSDFKNNYPFYLSPVNVNANVGFWSMPLPSVHVFYDFRVVSSSAERENKRLQGGLKRKQLRNVMSMAYFSRMMSSPFYNLNAVQPYLISFSKLYLGIDFPVNPKDVLKAFNGNIVSLSQFEPDGEEIFSVASERSDYFDIVVQPRVVPCLGIGFVRGIDCEAKKFYVLTHLLPGILDRVNCLSLGRVSPPHCMFVRQETVQGRTFYTTTCAGGSIRSVKRMFRVPGTPMIKDRPFP